MRILCDVNILVRANERSSGPVRALLLSLLEKGHILLTSSEILVELARVAALSAGAGAFRVE